MSKQVQLFERPKTPRLKRAHVYDAGQGMAQFQCKRCDWQSAWLECEHAETKQGIPCPVCNPVLPKEWGFLNDDT